MTTLLFDPAVVLAIGFATTSAVILAIGARVMGRRVTLQCLALCFVALFFLGLTQLPAPNLKMLQLQCPILGAQPNWLPFYSAAEMLKGLSHYLAHPVELQLQDLSLGPPEVAARIAKQVNDPVIFGGWGQPALLNLLVCLPIGFLIFPYLERVRSAVSTGLLLSLTIELTQLTATWGLFPCPYRKFDADDLLLNTLGMALGFWAAGRWRHGYLFKARR
jgi:hypothetical protein